MKVKEAIVLFEKQLKAAQVVLDSGFGTHPGEHDFLYRRRKEMAEIALAALRPAAADQPLTLEQLREMDGKPVWVDFTGSSFERPAGWFILKSVENGEAYLVGKTSVYKALEYYGIVWRAYAYPSTNINREAWDDCPICGKYKAISFRGYRTREEAIDLSGKIHPHVSGGAKFCPRCGKSIVSGARAERKGI